MKEVLLTGGCGFIASHLLEELVKNKDYNITVIDDLSTGKIHNIKDLTKYISFYRGKVQTFNFDNKFDIIYHLAAKANTREKGLKDFEDNVLATEAVTKMLKPEGRIIFSSSCAVYGNQTMVTELSPFKPISPYGYSKWMNELTIKLNCKNWTIFRFGNVFGERQDGSTEMGLVGVISYNLKNNTEMEVFNNGENERDYIYVRDIVKALISISNQEIYQVSQNKTYKTIELVNLSGVKYKIGRNNTEVSSIQLDNTKLKQLGWSPTLSVLDYINKIKNG